MFPGVPYKPMFRFILVMCVPAATCNLFLNLAGVKQLWPYLVIVGLGFLLTVLNEIRIAIRNRRKARGL